MNAHFPAPVSLSCQLNRRLIGFHNIYYYYYYYYYSHARIRQKQPTLKTVGKSFLSDSLQYPKENFLEDLQVSSACSYNSSIKVGWAMNNGEMILSGETLMFKVEFYHTQNTRLLQSMNCCLEKLGPSTVQITWDTQNMWAKCIQQVVYVVTFRL
jgi:hypothetical protein